MQNFQYYIHQVLSASLHVRLFEFVWLQRDFWQIRAYVGNLVSECSWVTNGPKADIDQVVSIRTTTVWYLPRNILYARDKVNITPGIQYGLQSCVRFSPGRLEQQHTPGVRWLVWILHISNRIFIPIMLLTVLTKSMFCILRDSIKSYKYGSFSLTH